MDHKESNKKHLGLCPWCGKEIRAKVKEENIIRRDFCVCPECGGNILVCRTPGCNNYAKGGEIWDDELCPECTKSLVAAGESTAVCVAVSTVVTKVLLDK